MSRPAAAIAFLLAVVATLLAAAPYTESAVSCSDVYNTLFPCLGYFQGSGNTVPSACCSGIKSVVSKAHTTPDRQATCTCLKTAAAGVSGTNVARVGALLGKCGVSVPYKISPTTDCSKVK